MSNFDMKISPLRDVNRESLFNLRRRFLEARKVSGNNHAFFGVEGKACVLCRFVENGLNDFKEFVTSKGAPDVIGAPSER